MAPLPTSIYSLPNEILISILSSFSTAHLLPLTTVSHRIHNTILSILQTRLIRAATLSSHSLILEVYRPAAKITTPYFVCDYMSTDTITPTATDDTFSQVGKLGEVRNIYSYYKPLQPEGERRVWRRHPAGGIYRSTINDLDQQSQPRSIDSASSTTNPILTDPETTLDEEPDDLYLLPSESLDLEPHELFTQLQSQVNLVKVGPRRGLFLSIVEVSEGLTRIWRNWLAERAQRWAAGQGSQRGGEYEERLLWSDKQKNIGLRVRVLARDDVPTPLLVSRHEDPHVGYTLVYEELVVRTSHLLLKYEQSLEQEVSSHGKALVIVS